MRSGRILNVGPGQEFARPSAAAAVALPGDTVRIAAGDYRDCAVWRTGNLVIEGAGGYAHVRDVACEGKAIWVFYAAPVTIRHVRFSGARVPWRNGAGIRWEGYGRLIVEDGWFDDNQMGILAHNRRASSIVVLASRFERNGHCETFCGHALYAGAISTLSVRNSEFSGQFFGHYIKSRARVSLIVGNRISDGEEGTGSYAINLPNGGIATIRGNSIQKGRNTDNRYCAICIGEEIEAGPEGARDNNFANPAGRILIEGNSFRNESGSDETAFVWNRSPQAVLMRENELTGPGMLYFEGDRPASDGSDAGRPD